MVVIKRQLQHQPWCLLLILALALLVQLYVRQSVFPLQPEARQFESLPPFPHVLEQWPGSPALSKRLMAQMLAIRLQLQDSQSGHFYSYRRLDYARLANWLWQIHLIDPASDYPLLLATRVYSQVPDVQKQRQMLLLVERMYQSDPVKFWPWLAEASVQAWHKLNDRRLALQFAETLHYLSQQEPLPPWVGDIKLLLLENLGEQQTALLLVKGLLQKNDLDPDEKRFLETRLLRLEQALSKSEH